MNLPPLSSNSRTSNSFDLLHPKIQRWIWQQGWDELHDIQEQAIDSILNSENDVVISAATARGKTEAAFLPICSSIADSPNSSVRVLYLGPLKALINDQFSRLEYLCEDLGIPVHRWHGDVDAAKKKKLLNKPSGILLITPESLEALFVIHGPKMKMLFHDLSYSVVDELHSFIGNERGKQLQSLLHRLEIIQKRQIKRIALSATLGDMPMAAEFLRKGGAENATLIDSSSHQPEIKLQIRGYIESEQDAVRTKNQSVTENQKISGDYIEVAKHLFKVLRGTNNLIFSNSRQEVEVYADLLRRYCVTEKLPNEFFPHHGSISKDLREDVEDRLKDKSLPINVVCTSTLEMGIDIGSVSSIAQIGVPFTVASVRQRLGRSGRRDDPAVLRMYVQEREITDRSPIQDYLRPHMVQAIAMVNLLLEKWYEPPKIEALHLSTLVQQILSMIAQYGGVKASEAWQCLCKSGPFSGVDQSMFISLLRGLGSNELITQTSDNLLLLDIMGERIVNHYSFFAAFSTPEEYRLIAEGKQLGTLPIAYPLVEGMYLIFAGRRWVVMSVDNEKKVIDLAASKGGRPPKFLGGGGSIDDRIREEMRRVYMSEEIPRFLDRTSVELLEEARKYFREFQLSKSIIYKSGKDSLVFLWKGDRIQNTLALMLKSKGLKVTIDGLSITVTDCDAEDLINHLRSIQAEVLINGQELAFNVTNKVNEKYDQYLGEDLLRADYASRYLNVSGTIRTLQHNEQLNS
ncbi:MAG: DEAD/DEAH box helicase [Candidatus Marinimicrobia bacterium]|nr:DEAD/DEAH box helicase [Candidatus Neomarinimicrobiota bacterium]